MKWTEFDPVTGRIQQIVSGVQLTQPDASPTKGILNDVMGDATIAYVDIATAGLIARPPSAITLSQAGAVVTLTNVNQGSVVMVSGDAMEVIDQDGTDGSLQISFSHPGSYLISVEQFPQLVFTAEVDVQ